MCLYPRVILNRKYLPNKKNNYEPPAVKDERVKYVPVGCGKCLECIQKRGRDWSIRLQEEIRTNKTGIFVTLTFSNESIKELTEAVYEANGGEIIDGYELDNEIATIATRRFLERWRKKHGKSIKHWLTTELGHNGTENIHIHGIIFTNENENHTKGIAEQYAKQQRKDITEIWGYGFTYLGDYCNEATVQYICKYTTKIDKKHTQYKPKILCSKGIGRNYTLRIDAGLNVYKETKTDETYKTRSGRKMALPVYYRNKIYQEEEREKLWIEKIEKQERWIMGQKVSIKNGWEEYFKLLGEAREKNNRLGYGNNMTNWNRKNYEEDLRRINLDKRIKAIENREPIQDTRSVKNRMRILEKSYT